MRRSTNRARVHRSEFFPSGRLQLTFSASTIHRKVDFKKSHEMNQQQITYRVLAGITLLVAATAPGHSQTRTPFANLGVLSAPKPTPFADSNGLIPPNYSGPLFKLSHDYPATLLPQERTAVAQGDWQRSDHGFERRRVHGGIEELCRGRYAPDADRVPQLERRQTWLVQ